ncbi:MAG: hypothetical protein NT038_09270 [Euryarchaeota archaeon]|nr:hypothetical protein [Euryarchaeota archaeon]
MDILKKNAIVKVSCDCCGKEIECPESMLKTAKKHACYQCFQDPKNFNKFTDEERKNVHVDIPMEQIADTVAENFATTMVDEMFSEIWSKKKVEFKEFSKKDLAKEMFGAGIFLGIQAFMDSQNDMEKTPKNKMKH